jgi:hypothetical protein
MVADSGMSLDFLGACASKRHTMIYRNVFPDFRSFADNNTHPMIYKKTPSYSGARVNFYAGESAVELGHGPT